MNKKQTGGSAFPFDDSFWMKGKNSGMSLRDWFAGRALASLISNPTLTSKGDNEASEYDLAIAAYAIADAMIETRDR